MNLSELTLYELETVAQGETGAKRAGLFGLLFDLKMTGRGVFDSQKYILHDTPRGRELYKIDNMSSKEVNEKTVL